MTLRDHDSCRFPLYIYITDERNGISCCFCFFLRFYRLVFGISCLFCFFFLLFFFWFLEVAGPQKPIQLLVFARSRKFHTNTTRQIASIYSIKELVFRAVFVFYRLVFGISCLFCFFFLLFFFWFLEVAGPQKPIYNCWFLHDLVRFINYDKKNHINIQSKKWYFVFLLVFFFGFTT